MPNSFESTQLAKSARFFTIIAALSTLAVLAILIKTGLNIRVFAVGSIALSCALTSFLLKNHAYQTLGKYLGITVLLIAGNYMFWVNGAFNSAASGWLFIVPFIIGIMLGRKQAITVFAINMISACIASYLQYGLGRSLLLTDGFIPIFSQLFHIVTLAGVTVYTLNRFLTDSDETITQLNSVITDLNRSISVKNEFLTNMSHELRTPLNGIYGVLQIFKEKQWETNEKTLFDAALSSTEALNRIVDDILDYDKLSHGFVELDPHWTNTRAMFSNLVALYDSATKVKNLRFKFSISNQTPLEIFCDEFRVRQIVNNIVGNAVKFTDQGSIEVSIDYLGSNLIIKVVDTGVGMPIETQALLFESFSQGDSRSTRHFAGIGLGMSITKKLVTLMRGEINVLSEVDLGSSFTVTIPCNGRANTEFSDRVTFNQNLDLGHLKILYVEDIETNLLVGKAALAMHFKDIETARNGAEALTKIHNRKFDVVITDISMPIMNGMELFEEIQKFCPELPVIALTGHGEQASIDAYLNKGFSAVLLKPFEMTVLIATIQNLFKKAPVLPTNAF